MNTHPASDQGHAPNRDRALAAAQVYREAVHAYVLAAVTYLRDSTGLSLPVVEGPSEESPASLTVLVHTAHGTGTVALDLDDRIQCCTLRFDRLPRALASRVYSGVWGDKEHGHFGGASTLDAASPGDKFVHEDPNDDRDRRTLDDLTVEVLDDTHTRIDLADIQLWDTVIALRLLTGQMT